VWATVALALSAVVLVLGAYAAVVLLVKRRRRARRRRADVPALAVQGAWDEALDRLREAEVAADPSLTPLELARAAPAVTALGAARPLRTLARTYTASRYGDRPPAAADASAAWESVDELTRALDASVPRGRRWRRRLSPTTLRVPAGRGSR
jgi:hypothetical protein